jgi:predicted transport protein
LLARQRENYRYPPDEEFRRALREGDLYGLRVCRHLLERLENHNTKEPSDTTGYSIEHVMPQNERINADWRKMLGPEWKEIQKTWLHRLGNLTLTGYNSKYSDRSFEEKKSITGGFSDSSVRLNKYIRDQPQWTAVEMSIRTDDLSARALRVWPPLSVDQSLVEAAQLEEKRELASRRDVSAVEMSPEARLLFDAVRAHVTALDSDILELAESNSVSYHDPGFFLEILPRRYRVLLLLPLDFNEIDDPSGLARDATEWKFLVHARYEGGVFVSINDVETIEKVMPLVRQAHATCQ